MTFTSDEVQALITPILEHFKRFSYRFDRIKTKEIPEFYTTYKKAIQYEDRIKIHSEICDFPEQLFMDRSPNQTDIEFKYMRDNFKNNTRPVFLDSLFTNMRSFNDGNWNIYYREDDPDFISMNETFQDYVENNIMGFDSLENYVKMFLAATKMVDANGVVAVKPKEVTYIQDDEGELYTDDSILIEPQPYYYNCSQVLSDPKFDHEYFILESNEKSKVEFNGKQELKGRVFEVYDENYIWRIEQTGRYVEHIFSAPYIYYEHGWDKVPAQRLKGIPKMVGDSILWQAPFLFACDILDIALMNHAYLQCTIANSMFPYRVMIGNICTFRYREESGNYYSCDHGEVFSEKSGSNITCPECKGLGLKDRISPLGTMLLEPGTMTGEGDQRFSGNALYYVSPETNASEFVKKKIDDDISLAYEVTKAKRSNTAKGTGIGADGTATGEIMDMKAMYQPVKQFSDQIFSIYEFLLNAIGYMRYGEKFKSPIVSYPVTFDFNNEQDYLAQIKQAREASLPPGVIQHLIVRYLRALHFNERQTSMMLNLMLATDRFFVLSQDDILLKQKLGLAEKWELILHDSSVQFIDELIDENKDAEMCAENDCSKGFFAIDFDTQKEMLVNKAKDKANSIGQSAQIIPSVTLTEK